MIKQIAIVGTGVIAAGLAEVAALAGIKVVALGRSESSLSAGRLRLDHSLRTSVRKAKLTEADAARAKDGIHWVTSADLIAEAELIVEAVSETYDAKRSALELIAAHNESAIVTSTTSSMELPRLAELCADGRNFAGFHVFNPVPQMELVEVGFLCDVYPVTERAVLELAKQLGKTALVVRGNRPGYIANRLLLSLINQAAWMCHKNDVAPADIDRSLTLGCRHPLGPLATADLIGLDVVQEILTALHAVTQDERYAPCPAFKQLIDAGMTGAKSALGGFFAPRRPPTKTGPSAAAA